MPPSPETIESAGSRPATTKYDDVEYKLRRFMSDAPVSVKLSVVWAILLFCVVLLQVFAPQAEAMRQISLGSRLLPPFSFSDGHGMLPWHPLGTDQLGRDVLVRLTAGAGSSVSIAFIAAVVSLIIGVGLGLLASGLRGLADQLVSLLIDAQSALPFIVFALGVLVVAGSGDTSLTIILGLYGWDRIARLVRNLAISESGSEYVRNLRLVGATKWRIYIRHIGPNLTGPLLVSLTLLIPEIILLESTLSYLGVGVQPPATSLGNLIDEGGDYLQMAPWIALTPSAVLVVTALSFSCIGDWLQRRMIDPIRSQ